MKKFFILFILSVFLCSCTYFQVKDAIKKADNGNYVASLTELYNILKENNEDRRALDAFEIIYPNAEKQYYDELDITRGRDIIGYTKALLNLLRVQEIYYKLPTVSKNSIAIIKPPQAERVDIKKELAQSFFTIYCRWNQNRCRRARCRSKPPPGIPPAYRPDKPQSVQSAPAA